MLSDLLQFLMNCSNTDHMSRGVIFVMRVNFCVLHWIDDVAFIEFLLFIFRYYDIHTHVPSHWRMFCYVTISISPRINSLEKFRGNAWLDVTYSVAGSDKCGGWT